MPKEKKPKLTKEERAVKKRDAEETEYKVWKLRQPPHNCSQLSIAEKLGITQGAVSKALARARKKYGVRHEEEIDAEIEEQLSKLDFIIEEATIAWRKSKKPRRKIQVKKDVPKEVILKTSDEIEDADEIRIDYPRGLKTTRYFNEVTAERENRDGNPAWLHVIANALKDRAEIKGIKAPTKTAFTNPKGDEEAGFSKAEDSMSDKEIANRLLSIIRKGKKRREASPHAKD